MRSRRRAAGVVAAVSCAIGGASRAGAEELRANLRVDVPVTAGGAAGLAVSEAVLHSRGPLACRWCDRDDTGRDTLNVVDRTARQLRWSDPHTADVLSDVTGFILTPLASGGANAIAAAHDGRGSGIATDLLVVAEAGILAADLNELAKLLVLRERPDVHALDGEARRAHVASVQDDLSFYSGHTTEAVSLAVAAGTVASFRGYRLAPMVWATALPPALVTGYLRIGADRHYLTDVLVGAVSGALIGFLVPYLHGPSSSDAESGGASIRSSAPVAQPFLLGYAGTW